MGTSLAKFFYKKSRESGGQISPWNLKKQIKTPNLGNLKSTSKSHFPNPNNQKKIHYKGNKLNHWSLVAGDSARLEQRRHKARRRQWRKARMIESSRVGARMELRLVSRCGWWQLDTNPEPWTRIPKLLLYLCLFKSGNLGTSWRVGFFGLKIGLVISESGSVGCSLGCLHL